MAECQRCGAFYPDAREALGYDICLDCGDGAARAERAGWCIVPTPKGHYTRITNPEELKTLNQKVR